MINTDNIRAGIKLSRELREKMLKDPYRPRYHFVMPEDLGVPGDPNGAFYNDGVYHLMYLYNRIGNENWHNADFCWGHISSIDLVHWRHHPDSIISGDGDGGCFSGGAFVDDDGTAYISYWKLPLKGEDVKGSGIGFAKSNDKYFEKWEKINSAAIEGTEFGILETTNEKGEIIYLGNADPSNIWKKDGVYFVQTGNLSVLNKYGRDADSPIEYRGDWVDLYKSKDLKSWEYVHHFYQRDTSNKWTDETEDDMCPSFLPLPSSYNGGEFSSKYLQLFIAHNKGCQYYIGEYDKERDLFLPEKHGRMSWKDNTYFAPEALIDSKGRHIMWAWLLDNDKSNEDALNIDGYSGVYGLPRLLWLGDDGELAMAPVPEIEVLRFNEISYPSYSLNDSISQKLCDTNDLACEINLTISNITASKTGVIISYNDNDKTILYYDTINKKLVFDATKSGSTTRAIIEEAPFSLGDDEKLELRIFIDRSVIEIYANDRQAICRRVYFQSIENDGIKLFADGGIADFKKITFYNMAASNPY